MCGPDVTEWLKAAMEANRKATRDAWQRMGYGEFADWWVSMVGKGRPWDYKLMAFRTDRCPRDCEGVTLCGLCMAADVIGNIHYAYVGRAVFSRNMLFAGSEYAARGERPSPLQVAWYHPPTDRTADPLHDIAAMLIGMDVADWGEDLCKAVRGKLDGSLKERVVDCPVCPDRFPI